MILKGLLNAAIISLLYMAYRYGDDMEMFWLCMVGSGLFIRKLYIISKAT